MLKQFYYKKNRIQQLKGFYHTAQLGSVSKASEKMGLTQSAVTLQIQSLERDIGFSLFYRDKQKIRLTSEGKLLYLQSVYYIQGIDDLFESFSSFINDKKKNLISIASNHAGISYILPKYIKKFRNFNSEVKFRISNLSKDECISRILDNEIDFFIYPSTNDAIVSELDFYPIVKYKPILLSHKNHPLSKKKKVTLGDISKYELVRIDPKFITLPAFEELLKAHKIKSNIEFEMSDWEILKKFVKANIGVAMISNIILEGEKEEDLVQTDLTEYFPAMDYGIFIKKGKKVDGILKEFLNILSNEKLLFANK